MLDKTERAYFESLSWEKLKPLRDEHDAELNKILHTPTAAKSPAPYTHEIRRFRKKLAEVRIQAYIETYQRVGRYPDESEFDEFANELLKIVDHKGNNLPSHFKGALSPFPLSAVERIEEQLSNELRQDAAIALSSLHHFINEGKLAASQQAQPNQQMDSPTPDERFNEFQKYVGEQCHTVSDLEWDKVKEFLEQIPKEIERVGFLKHLAKLPDDGVVNNIVTNPTVHRRNQDAFLSPLRKECTQLLSNHFNLETVLKKARLIEDHGEALTYLGKVWLEYIEYHPSIRQNSHSPEELAFRNAIDFEKEHRKDLLVASLARNQSRLAGNLPMGDIYHAGPARTIEKANTSQRDQVFISYSHKDKNYFDKLQTSLKPLVKDKTITVWDDTKIQSGDKWREEIEQAIGSAKVAVLLVSPDFLASDFIAEHELLPLLDAAQNEGLRILWIAVRYSLYEETEIAHYQAVNDPARPLAKMSGASREEELVRICKEIKSAVLETNAEYHPATTQHVTGGNASTQSTNNQASENLKRVIARSHTPDAIRPDLISTFVILLISSAIIIFFFWISSQYLGLSQFQKLPDFIAGTYKGIWSSLITGAAGIGLAILRAFAVKDAPQPNYLKLILITTGVLFIPILSLIFLPSLVLPRSSFSPPPGVTPIRITETKQQEFELTEAAPLPHFLSYVLKGNFVVKDNLLRGHLEEGKLTVATELPKMFPETVTKLSFRVCYIHSVNGVDQMDAFPVSPKSRDSIDVNFPLKAGSTYTFPQSDFTFELPEGYDFERAWLCAAIWTEVSYFPAQ